MGAVGERISAQNQNQLKPRNSSRFGKSCLRFMSESILKLCVMVKAGKRRSSDLDRSQVRTKVGAVLCTLVSATVD